MTKRFTKTMVSLATLTTLIGTSLPLFADENPNAEPARREEYLHHGRGGFMTGVCVGQSMAQQGVTIPPGTDPRTWDSGTQAAFKTATENCRSEERGGPTTSPSTTPSQAPAPTQTPAPSPTPTATQTATPSPTPSDTGTSNVR